MDPRGENLIGSGSENVQKGIPFILLPKPEPGESSINQLRRLIEHGKMIGILRANADNQKPREVAQMPPDSWLISIESKIDFTADLKSRALPQVGHSFRTLVATKPDGTMEISFGSNQINTDDQDQSPRSIVYGNWIPIESLEKSYVEEAKQKSTKVNQSQGLPIPKRLTLKTNELPTTFFEFI